MWRPSQISTIYWRREAQFGLPWELRNLPAQNWSLLTVHSTIPLLEVKMGTPMRTVIDEIGGGMRYPVKAYQVGGPLGGLVPASRIYDLTLDFESFAREGFLLGHAGIVSVPEDFPVIELLEHLFEFTKKESCGKCFPCRIGSARGLDLLTGAVSGGQKIDRQLFDDLLDTMQIGSLCALGGGLPLPVKNALQYFSDELKDYFTGKEA
jgi:NADH-quinone oxidoreductase subunit F